MGVILSLPLPGQGFDAELTRQETRINIDGNSLVRTMSYEIKVNNRAGEKYCNVVLPYDKMERISRIDGFIRDNRGNVVRRLKPGEIRTRSAFADFSFFEDSYVKEFTLKHNEYPYTICYSYQVRQDQFHYIDHWIPVIGLRIPTRKATLVVDIPKDYKIYHIERFTDGFTVDSSGASYRYTWNATYSGQIVPETFSPPADQFMPLVSVVPGSFVYDIPGSLEDWKTFGKWQYELNSKLSDLPAEEKARIKNYVKDIDDIREKIRLLYHYLQDETRYINISMKTGGLKPYPASYVATKKYGDCKALTNYFKAVLECIDIPAYYTKVFAGSPVEPINLAFPSQQFNHVILCVPLGGDTLWLDCTSDLAFGYLGTFTQNRDALLIDRENSRFTRTPALKPQEVTINRSIEITPKSSKTVEAKFTNTYRGAKYEELAFLYQSVGESDRNLYIRTKLIEKGVDLLDLQPAVFVRDSAFLRLSYTAGSEKIAAPYGNEIMIKMVPFPVPLFEDPVRRKLPVQTDYPVNWVDTLVYEMPSGHSIQGIIPDQDIRSRYGHYSLTHHRKGNSILVVKRFFLSPLNIPLQEYPVFFEFIDRVRQSENKPCIILTKSPF